MLAAEPAFTDYLVLSALLFGVGAVGVLVRRNIIVVLMCLELMLNAVNITLAAASLQVGNLDGQVLVFLSLSVAAAEVVVGLAMVVAIYRTRHTINIDDLNLLRG